MGSLCYASCKLLGMLYTTLRQRHTELVIARYMPVGNGEQSRHFKNAGKEHSTGRDEKTQIRCLPQQQMGYKRQKEA